MSISSGFFNSINGDRLYNAETIRNYFEGIVSDGVYQNVGNKLQVLAGDNSMTVKVRSGRAVIDGYWIKNNEDYTLTLNAADATNPRYDAVVLKLDRTTISRSFTMEIKTGVASSSPVKPTMTDANGVTEKCLAYIYVPANTTAIYQQNIIDMRSSNLCGWVTGLIQQVDTSDLFLQFQTAYESFYNQSTNAFDTWFSNLTGDLVLGANINKNERTIELAHSISGTDYPFEDISSNYYGNYDKEHDLLMVFSNGEKLVENIDYEIKHRSGITSYYSIFAMPGKTISSGVIEVIVVHAAISCSLAIN